MGWGGVVGVVENKAISAQPTELELDLAGLSLAIKSHGVKDVWVEEKHSPCLQVSGLLSIYLVIDILQG